MQRALIKMSLTKVNLKQF